MKAFLARFHRSSSTPRLPVTARIAPADAPKDIFASLPFELHVLLVAHLEPRDILFAILSGSRAIRLIWLSEEMWPAVADRWYPGLTQHIRLTVDDERSRAELFFKTLIRITRKTEGKFASAMHYGFGLSLDEFFHLSKDVTINHGGVHSYESIEDLEPDDAQRFSRFMIYNNGRVAWWPEAYVMPYLAVVDDLRTRVRRIYLFPGHRQSMRGYKTAMGNKLFIMGHGTTLNVWHLELNRLESFEVPEHFRRCITEDETVLVLSQTSDVFVWRFGQTMKRIDMQKLGCYPREFVFVGGPPVWIPRIWLSSQQGLHLRNSQMLIDFIVSPLSPGIFFVVTLGLESGQLTVYEVNDGEVIETYFLDNSIYRSPRTTERGLLKWEKLDSYGGYCLVQVIQEPGVSEDAQGSATCPCGRNSRQLVSLCFNIYTKVFTALRHHLGALSPWISQIWNNRLFIMDSRFHDRPAPLKRRPVMSLAPCSIGTPWGKEATVKMHASEPGQTPLIRRRLQQVIETGDMGSDLDIEFGLDLLQEYSPSAVWTSSFVPCPSEINPGKLIGDDEFFLFINSPTYTVLSFVDDFPTKLPATEEIKSRWWRKQRGKEGAKKEI
ncbi:hypothetical protein F5Y16DRAFT_412716 [Xylariaceae sp. FL0255]|nr:hypothetical protein F5Y16DRAFT_412716 [Xylariaceae sp. FL0255]